MLKYLRLWRVFRWPWGYMTKGRWIAIGRALHFIRPKRKAAVKDGEEG